MRPRLQHIVRGLAVAAALAAGDAAAEPVRGKTEAGIAYAMGGATVSDLQALERHKDRFSLWITTAAKKTGAYLADVQVRITRADGRLMFNAPIPGPWLFIDLPPGRYRVEATHRGMPQTRTTQIQPGDRHQLLFHFDDPAEVSPEWERPFKDNPYGK
jgi:hypothetical protein